MLSVRLVVADHYMSPPIPELDVRYSEFRGTEVKQVPVIRIFGSTIMGKKTCLHIHGVFPYIYIPYEGSGPHERLMYQIASSLDKALNISLGKANSAVQHVYKVVLVSGLPFYGFHTKEHQYFKIYFYNPLMVKKATELLQSGAILSKMYQAHEAHIPYILQFMIDYNLYGMNLVNLENVKFRRDPENPGSSENLSEEMLLPESVTRISTCEVEADVMAADITNMRTVTDELVVNPGLAAIWEDEKQRRREEGRTSQITPQSSQGRLSAVCTDSEAFFKQKLHEKLLLLNSQISDSSSPLPDTPDVTRTPYPAETPENSELVEASFLDVHVQSSGSGSFTRNEQMEQNDDTSFVDEDLVLSLSSSQREAGGTRDSVVLGSQDVVLAEILHGLDNSVDADEDSVLGSQVPQKLGNEAVDGSDNEDMQDLSQPLDGAVNSDAADDFQRGSLNRFTDHQNDSLWEDTFWDSVNKTIPQLDGTDDILDMPRRRRLGIRGKLFSKKAAHRPTVNGSITTVVRSDEFLGTVDSEKKLCNGVAECKSIECSVSVSPDGEDLHVDQADDIKITSDRKNSAIAADVETEHECDVTTSSLIVVSDGSNGCLAMEGMEASSEYVPVTTDGSMMDAKSHTIPIGTIDFETSAEINAVKLDRLLAPESDNDSAGVGSMQSLSQDCLSSENSLDALTVLHEGSVRAVTSEVVGAESLQIAFEDLLESSEDRTVSNAIDDMLIDPETNPCNHALSQVSGAGDSQRMKHIDSESGNRSPKGICSGFGPFRPTDESSNSEINFKPVCVVCCNTNNSSCTSDGSVPESHLSTSGSSFEVNGQYCEQFRQAVLIGDPSFTAQPSSSDGDNELQVNEISSNGNTSSTWLSSEQSSETSKSLYLSDIGTDLAEYDARTAQEISPVKNTFSCRISHQCKRSNKTQKSGRCNRLIQSRRVMTRSSQVGHTSGNKTEKPCMNCSTGRDFSVKTKVTEQISKCHVHPKLSLKTDTEEKDISIPTVSERPLDIFPVEVKRIESILWRGKMDEIIELKDSSVNDDVSTLNEVQSSRELLDSYVQKTWGKTKNRHRANANKDAVGKKCKEGVGLPMGDRMERSAVTAQTRSVLGKLVCENNNTLTKWSTLPASQLPAVKVHNGKYVGHSNRIRSEKLAKRLQREKRKRLSLSYRRKTASRTSGGRKKPVTNSIMSGESRTNKSTEKCLNSLRNVQCLDKQETSKGNNWADGSVPESGAELQKEQSQVTSVVRVQEHAAMPTVYADRDIRSKVKIIDCDRHLRCRGHVEGEVVSTVYTSVQSVENVAGCKVCSDSVRRHDRNANTVPVVRLSNCRLRASSPQRQKKLTNHDVTPDGLSDKSHFQAGETVNSVRNSAKHPLTSCLSGRKFPDLVQQLSKHGNRKNRRVQERHVDQLSKASHIPETLKPVDSNEKSKNHGQLKHVYVGVQRLEDGCKNWSGLCLKSTIEPHSEFRLPTDVQFISDVDSRDKEKVQNEEHENSHHMKSRRKALTKNALCNAADTCIRQCYVKLVRLEDTSQQIRISPCRSKLKIKKNRFSAHSRGLKNNLLKCSPSKTCGNVNRTLRSHGRHVVDHEELKMLHTTSNESTKAEPCKTSTQQKNSHLFGSGRRTQDSGMVTKGSSRHRTQDSGMVAELNIKEISAPGPAVDSMLNTTVYGGTATKTGGDIKRSENNILYDNMTSKQFSSNVTRGNIIGFVDCERSDVCSLSGQVPTRSRNKNQSDHLTGQSWDTTGTSRRQKSEPSLEECGNTVPHVQGQGDGDCMQIGRRKPSRRKTGDGKKHGSKKLLNSLQPYELSLLSNMRPVSITLERLDQSIIEKYSMSTSNVTSWTKPQKSTDFLSQEMIGTGNSSVNSGVGGHWKRRGKLKRIRYDKIPCLDGAFETSSSDDCSESESTHHSTQLGRSPVTKKARWPEEIMEIIENNLPDQKHENAGCSALTGMSPKKPHFGAPTKNLKNTSSFCETSSTVQSPRKSLYPPLAIKIQKSPKKGNVNAGDKFHERCPRKSDRSKSMKGISVYSNRSSSKKEQRRRLSSEEVKEARPKHVAVKQKFTNDKAHQQPKGICDILQKRKRKTSILVSPSQCFHMATELTVTPSSVCHDAGAKDDQRDTCAGERISSHAAKEENVRNEENCPIDILHNFSISSCDCSETLKSEATSVQSTSSSLLRTETKVDGVCELCLCPQTSHGAYVKSVNIIPTADGTEGWSAGLRLGKWVESGIRDTVSKIVRKQSKTPFVESHSENKSEVGTRDSDSDSISQGSIKMSASKAETSKSSALVRIDFPERKKIVKERQGVDVFHTEEIVSCKALLLRTDVVEGNLLSEGPTKPQLPKINSESTNGAQTSQSNLCMRTESLMNRSLDDNASTVCDGSARKVHQPTAESGYSLSDDGEYDEGILSFYDETMFLSPAVHVQFRDPLVKPSTPDDNSSKCAVDLQYALLTHTEQDSSEIVLKTSVNIVNGTPTNEQSCKRGSCFRFITTANKNCKVYTPRFNPPSKDEILASLSEFCIPEYRHQDPFVSNICDTGNKREVGNRVLKICSTSVRDLQPFVGSLLNTEDIETWRRKWLQELNCTTQRSTDQYSDINLGSIKPALASHREVVLTPCKLPPSAAEVKLWYETTEKLTSQNLQENYMEDKVCSRNIVLPLSPGQEPVSDDDVSLSPLTPKSISFEGSTMRSVAAVHSTPQIASPSKYLPSPSCTPIHNTKHKIAKMLLKHSRKGPKWNSPNQENVSSTLPFIREEPEEAATANGAYSDSPTTGHGSALPCVCEPSGLHKQQGSEDLSVVEAAHLANAVDPQSSSEVPDEGQCVDNLHLHNQIPAMPATWRAVKRLNSSCQIEESTPNNTYGFRMSFENLHNVKAICEHQFLTTFIMELHIQTRGDLRPDPAYDAIRALFYVVVNDVPENAGLSKDELGLIAVSNLDGGVKIPVLKGTAPNCKITYVEDETSLVHELVKCVSKWNPDILGGYEVEMLSWGYLFHRAYNLQINLVPLVSRVPTAKVDNQHAENGSRVSNLTEEIKLTGRIILNIWRLMRHEVAVQSYTFESVMYHILHQRVPRHSFKHLTYWWEHRTHLYRWICVEYYLLRVQGIVKLLDQLDLIGRTSELARLFGIQFFEVLSRGSQFRVESMMLRLAKPLNYVPVSPSIQQRARMRAPASLPLIMEPHSRFYSDPVIVLDFQSLYPSIIIAYNYCFSTCLGRVENLGQATPFVFGCTQLKVPPAHLMKLENSINISPCGVAFVNAGIRKGVLPQMLQEILDTRLMVKQSMKRHKSNKTLQRVLHSRQLGLKLIANVTYGYTSANFSGRMPCIEVGDSVVSKARETLERAIHLVEATPRWGAQVVYGDTDSLFVLVPGKSREQAFKIGAEIAEAVTLDNPKPVKLKLEKVYQPCILQTKKRYVGHMYESPDQETPVYDAKGIETVRRDGCPAVAKILEKSLKLVFETKNVSLVKNYVCRQFAKLLQGRLNIQDLIFAREYRGMSGYRPGACVPALELARRCLQTDRRAEPRQSERVPYVIVNGPPGLPLIRLVRAPHELLADSSLRPNATYYITRVIIPPLDRCFSLLGAEVESWYAEMPRKFVTSLPTAMPCGLKKSTISQYFATMSCAVCNQLTNSGVCLSCQQKPEQVAVVLTNKIRTWERTYSNITKVCQSCCGRPDAIECISLDCPVMFRRNQSARDLEQAPFIRSLQEQYLTF